MAREAIALCIEELRKRDEEIPNDKNFGVFFKFDDINC